MDDRQVARSLVKLAKSLVSEADKGTFKCPECGTKVLKQTSYCVKCQKKVKQAGNRAVRPKSVIKTTQQENTTDDRQVAQVLVKLARSLVAGGSDD